MTRRPDRALILSVAGVAAAFFALNCLTPFYGDDYSYMFTYAAGAPKLRIETLGELYLSQLNHYRVMNGRAIVHTLVQLLLMPDGKLLFNVCNTLVFAALGLAVCRAARGTLKGLRPLPLLAAYALIWLCSPGFGQSCLWLTGSVNYMWTALAALAFLLPYRSDGPGAGRVWLRAPGMFLLGVLAGWSGENACIAAAAGVVLLLARRALLGLGFRAWMWTGLAGFLAGAAALFLSPAQSLRAEHMGGLGGLGTWIGRIPSVSYHALLNLWLPLAVGAVLLALSIAGSRGQGFISWLKRYSAAAVWFCSSLVSAYCMCAAPYFPDRAWFASVVFAAATLLAAYDALPEPRRPRRAVLRAAAAAACAVCVLTYAAAAVDINASRAAVLERGESVLAQKEEGVSDVLAAGVTGRTRWNCFTAEPDITSDPAAWQNAALALYYGVGSVNLIQ